MDIKITQSKGLTSATKKLTLFQRLRISAILNTYGKLGVSALSSATPVATGETARSWTYALAETSTGYSISWSNSNVVGGTPLVILLHYGHGTRGGTFIQGRDFINPVIQSVIDDLSKSIKKEVANV